MASILSERIAALRKERGLTQEQLGKLVGVSSQAVGKWEKGGAPDVELLPALSRHLGVTTDALFGLDGGEQTNVEDVVRRWILTVPKGQQLDQLCSLVWAAIKGMISCADVKPGDDPTLTSSDRCEQLIDAFDRSKASSLVQTSFLFREGMIHDVHAEDFSFVSVWPEPRAGYETFLAPNQVYRRLFQALARPKCLELLELLNSKAARYYVADTLAASLGMERQEAEALLKELTDLHLLTQIDLELQGGPVHAYTLQESGTFIPFLYLARCLAGHAIPMVHYSSRELPMLRGEKWKEA